MENKSIKDEKKKMYLNHCTVKLIYWIIVTISTVGKDQYFLCYDSTTSHDYMIQS